VEDSNWAHILQKDTVIQKKFNFTVVCCPLSSELQNAFRKFEIYTTEERKLRLGKKFGDDVLQIVSSD